MFGIDYPSCFVIIIASVFCFIGSYYYEPISDELAYRFFLDETYGTKFYDRTINTVWDAMASQTNEYFNHSGRFLVHTITQIFSGILGRTWFSICNAFVFSITIIALALRIKGLSNDKRFLFTCLLSIVFLFIFPGYRLFPIALSLNYLWPLPIILLFLQEFKKELSILSLRGGRTVYLSLLGLFAGATQEVYIVPIGALTFCIIVIRICQHRKLNLNIILLCLLFWVGSLTVCLAPGTLKRGSGLTCYALSYFYSTIMMISEQPLFITAVVLFVFYAVFKRRVLYKFRYQILLVVISLIFGIFAHTTDQSFSGLEFFSLLFLIKAFVIFNHGRGSSGKKITMLLSAICLFILLVYQSLVRYEYFKYYVRNHKIVCDYISSPDGVVFYKDINTSHLIPKDGKFDFVYMLALSGVKGGYIYSIMQAYGNETKPITLFPERCIPYFEDSTIQKAKSDSFGAFVKVGAFYLAPIDSTKTEGDTLFVACAPKHLEWPIISKIRANRHSDYSPEWTREKPVDEIPIMDTRWGKFWIIETNDEMWVKSIRFLSDVSHTN